jgi:hypothetical protein
MLNQFLHSAFYILHFPMSRRYRVPLPLFASLSTSRKFSVPTDPRSPWGPGYGAEHAR